jgi:metal-responsive CopG/Arc/MetJ family transcriptional regulator
MSKNPKNKQVNNKSSTADSIRINLSISKSLLKLVDEAAERDFTNRSDLIRQSILWYLRPQGRDLDQTDPEIILQTIKNRQLQVSIRKMIAEGVDKDITQED